MSEHGFILRSQRVVLPDGIRPATITIAEGTIQSIDEASSHHAHVIDVGEAAILPGLVDTHVHVNEPGRTDWEGFETATRAAAAGGVTTIVDMPLNSNPVTTTVSAYRRKLAAAESACHVDHGFWGGIVPSNAAECEPLIAMGVLGFKIFLCPSGIPEFPAVGDETLRAVMPIIARHRMVLLAHAEDPRVLAEAAAATGSGDACSYARYLASRPPEAEVRAIQRLVALSAATGCPIHIVHVATHKALPVIREARRRGIPITSETCPHYLTFSADAITDRVTLFKCAPPIRSREDRQRLWTSLQQNEIDAIVSDHSPCPPDLKGEGSDDLRAAWGGIASLQLGLSIVWTGARARGIDLDLVAQWMSTAPARLASLVPVKGAIAPVAHADLVVFDPEATMVVEPGMLYHRHPATPYAGMELSGCVRRTYLRGEVVFDAEDGFGPPRGRLVSRGAR